MKQAQLTRCSYLVLCFDVFTDSELPRDAYEWTVLRARMVQLLQEKETTT